MLLQNDVGLRNLLLILAAIIPVDALVWHMSLRGIF